MIIAVDGPAASGKGTLSRRLAAHYGLAYLDTGRLYRATGAAALRTGADFTDADAIAGLAEMLDPAGLDAPALDDERVADAASRVAALAPVRAALLAYQRAFASQPGGAVLDGRDIATVVCPQAAVKLYITASVEERARRRAAQLRAAGGAVDETQLVEELKARDARDRGRAAAPLRQADDAHLLDTTAMSIEEVEAAAIAWVDAVLART